MLEKFSYLEFSLNCHIKFRRTQNVTHEIEIPEWASLAFIALSLLAGILVSLRMSQLEDAKKDS
jgi:tellurite resistance protein TerC